MLFFWPAYTSLKEQTTEVSQICASCFTLALFGFYLFLCNSHWGQVFMGRCWSSRREVIVKWICSAELPAQILAHSQSLLKANFLYSVTDSVEEAFAPVCEAHSGYENIEVTPGKLCTPCYIHVVVGEIRTSSRAVSVSKPSQCRSSEGSSRGSFKGQTGTLPHCHWLRAFSCYLLVIEGQLPVTPCGFGGCGAALFILQLCLLWGSDILLFNSTKSFLIKKPSRGTSSRQELCEQ